LIRKTRQRISFGIAIYIFLVIAQTNAVTCGPLQTPPAHAVDRHSINGDWSLTTTENTRPTEEPRYTTSDFKMACQNDRLKGEGNEHEKRFGIEGTLQKSSEFNFTKIYLPAATVPGPNQRVDYYGKLDTSGPSPTAKGTWKAEVTRGHFLTTKPFILQGTWKAEMTHSHTYAFTDFAGH
jgi:hypothetical protein